MLLLLFGMLSELCFNGLTSEASRANGVEFIAEYANDLRRHSMVQDRDVVLNFSLIVLRDGAFGQMLSSSTTNLFHIGKKCSWTHVCPSLFGELGASKLVSQTALHLSPTLLGIGLLARDLPK